MNNAELATILTRYGRADPLPWEQVQQDVRTLAIAAAGRANVLRATMGTSADERLCYFCERPFGRSSQEAWVLDDAFRPVGTAHKTCFRKHRGGAEYPFPVSEPLRCVQFQSWAWLLPPVPTDSTEDLARSLVFYVEDATLSLPERAREREAAWREGIRRLTGEQVAAVYACYAALVERFNREVPEATPGRAGGGEGS
jgi:hypothetical protein